MAWADVLAEGELETMMTAIFREDLATSDSYGSRWASLAGEQLWIKSPATLRAALAAHESRAGDEATAWDNVIKLLGDVGIPDMAKPTVEAALRKRLLLPSSTPADAFLASPGGGTPSSATFGGATPANSTPAGSTPGSTPGSTRRTITSALVYLDPLPFTPKGRSELAADASGAAKFWNEENVWVYRTHGWELNKEKRTTEVTHRWNMRHKDPNAFEKEIVKQGGLDAKVKAFFEKPRGGGGAGWKPPDRHSAASVQNATDLFEKVRRLDARVQEAKSKLPALKTAGHARPRTLPLRQCMCRPFPTETHGSQTRQPMPSCFAHHHLTLYAALVSQPRGCGA